MLQPKTQSIPQMTETLRILQLNIRGILSAETQFIKCQKLNHLLETKQIDILLLQEWSAIKRCRVQDSEVFPKKFFPNYHTHFNSTETAILYHTGLCVTPLNTPTDYLKPTHQDNFHICGIILHSQTNDHGISRYIELNHRPIPDI